jgi:uncharacterized repeat protein (TIGR02543 family)
MKNVLKKLAVCMIAMAMLMSVRAIFAADVSAEAATTYTISYFVQGTSAPSSNPTSFSTNDAPFTLDSPTVDGWVFASWYCKECGVYIGSTFDPSKHSSDVTLVARWVQDGEYFLVFHYDYTCDGVSDTVEIEKPKTVGASIDLPGPEIISRDGYTLVGWNTKEDGSGTMYNCGIANLPNKTGDFVKLYAQWEEITYDITYVLNGGTNNTANPSTYTGKNAITLSAPTREGYTFGGWYTDSSFTDAISTIPAGSTGDLTLYAMWTPITYTIKFDGNGSTSGSMSNLKLEYDTASTLTANSYTLYGYTFGEWNTASDGSGTSYADKASVKNLSATAGGTVTLYAQWYPNYFYLNLDGNGSTSGSYTDKYWGYTGFDYGLPANVYERAGYTFAGWNTKKDGSGKSFSDKGGVIVTSPYDGYTVSLYAQWQLVTYTITYQLNGGTNDSKNPSSYTIESANITLKNPTRSGYTFKGWYSDSAFKTAVSSIKKGSSGNLNLYAKWEENAKQETGSNQETSSTQEQTATKKQAVYTIKFNGNGSTSGSMSAMKKCSYDTSYTLSQNKFKKKGYTFAGWNTQKDGSGKKYGDTASVKNLANKSSKSITLYAQWTSVDYSITYVLNGGTNNVKNPSGYRTSKKVTLAKPTKEGYTFVGWYSNKKCTKKVTSIKKGSSGNKKFYAKWKVNTYTIVFNGNGSTGGSMSSKKSLAYNKSYKLTKNKFTKKGYTFAGWNTKKDGSGTSYKNAASVKKLTAKNKGKITLYAQWTKNKEEKTTVTCPTCNGNKTVSCTKCDNGKVNCDTCKGRGFTIVPGQAQVDCTVCGATGKVDCTTCGGDGKVECSTCNGKGTVIK